VKHVVLGRLLRVGEAKTLKRLRVIADHVNAIEDDYVAMSDDELRGQTAAFKERLEKGESTDDLLVEAFAVVREAAKRTLGIENLYESVNTPLVGFLNNALKAKELYKKDRDYIVVNGEVLIVDEFTGRVLHGRRYNEGMHQAIEAKERVEIKAENQTLATITLQNYFRLYEKLSGMTGTAQTEAAELHQTYGLGVVPIPPNRPVQRADEADLIYKTEDAKFAAVVTDLAERHEKGQPVLVGTA
jgi:preprotein translocase subunit SecA